MNLFLFTKHFPYGKGETFLENEIPYLTSQFDKVYIFPQIKQDGVRSIPQNTEVIDMEFGPTKGLKKIVFSNLLRILKIVCLDLFSNENRKALFRPKAYIDDLFRLLFEASVLKCKLDELEPTPRKLYTYWFDNWTAVLSLVKKRDLLVTRSHGFDFNMSRNDNGFYPFRPFVWSKLDRNFNVSNFGSDYLKLNYSNYSNRVETAYLGVKDQSIISKKGNTVVSCSNVIPLKRVELIVEVLKAINRPLKWVHFGEGESMENLKLKVKELPSNISVELMGSQSNETVLKYYSTNEIGGFIHLSSSEGLPVSMMEVQSFGIPIMACDVGGVSEIVNDETGKLIPSEFSIKEASEALIYIMDLDDSKRQEIQKNQQDKFSANKNYTHFAKKLIA